MNGRHSILDSFPRPSKSGVPRQDGQGRRCGKINELLEKHNKKGVMRQLWQFNGWFAVENQRHRNRIRVVKSGWEKEMGEKLFAVLTWERRIRRMELGQTWLEVWDMRRYDVDVTWTWGMTWSWSWRARDVDMIYLILYTRIKMGLSGILNWWAELSRFQSWEFHRWLIVI